MRRILLGVIAFLLTATAIGQISSPGFTPTLSLNTGQAWGIKPYAAYKQCYVPTMHVEVGCEIAMRHGALMLSVGVGSRTFYRQFLTQLECNWFDVDLLQVGYRYPLSDRWDIALGVGLKKWHRTSSDTWFKRNGAKYGSVGDEIADPQFPVWTHIDGYYALTNYCHLHGCAYFLYTKKDYRMDYRAYISDYNPLQIGFLVGLQFRLGSL